MKIILFSRPLNQTHKDKICRIMATIERYGFDLAVNEEAASGVEMLCGCTIAPNQRYGADIGEQSDKAVMVCFGGDGTLLDGVHRLGGRDIPVVGINSGRLGFLSIAQSEEIEEASAREEEELLKNPTPEIPEEGAIEAEELSGENTEDATENEVNEE